MFKIYNPETEKIEKVEKIDYKKHYHISGAPFTDIPEEKVVEKVEAPKKVTKK